MTSLVAAMESEGLLSEKIFVPNANVVLVMGATGVGKSYFVNSVHGSPRSWESSLLAPGTTNCIAVPTEIGGTRLILIDTPGFDDPDSTDSQILEKISTLLSALNYINVNLKGLVYLHRITDIRFPRSAVRTLRIFKHICGDGALSNVVLATTRWDGVKESDGAKRERQLRENYWRYVLDKGAQMTRYQGTGDSAKGIIGDLMGKASVVLDLQRELHSGKVLSQTGAGKLVREDLENLKEEYEKSLEELRKLRETYTSSDRGAGRIQKDMEHQMTQLEQAREDEKRLNRPIAEDVLKEIEREVPTAKRPHRGIAQIIATIVDVLSHFLRLDSSARDDISDLLSDTIDDP